MLVWDTIPILLALRDEQVSQPGELDSWCLVCHIDSYFFILLYLSASLRIPDFGFVVSIYLEGNMSSVFLFQNWFINLERFVLLYIL